MKAPNWLRSGYSKVAQVVMTVIEGRAPTEWGDAAIAAFSSLQQRGEQTAWCLLIISGASDREEALRRHQIKDALRAKNVPLPLEIQFCRWAAGDSKPTGDRPWMVGRLATTHEALSAAPRNNVFDDTGSDTNVF